MPVTYKIPINAGPTHEWPVVIVSDTFAAARHAELRVRQALVEFSGDARVKCHVWLLPSLQLPTLRRLATQQALNSNLVVLGPGAPLGLPRPVKDFLRDWVCQLVDRVCPLLLLRVGEQRAAGDIPLAAISDGEGKLRIPVFSNLPDAVSAARELAHWWKPKAAAAPAACEVADLEAAPTRDHRSSVRRRSHHG